MSQTVYLPTHEMELILKVQNLEGIFQKLTLCLRDWYQVPRRNWGFCLTWIPMVLGSTTGLQWNQWRHISILGQSLVPYFRQLHWFKCLADLKRGESSSFIVLGSSFTEGWGCKGCNYCSLKISLMPRSPLHAPGSHCHLAFHMLKIINQLMAIIMKCRVIWDKDCDTNINYLISIWPLDAPKFWFPCLNEVSVSFL